MPAPLPPLKIPETPRLSYIASPPGRVTVNAGGRPIDPLVIQLEGKFDPIQGEGSWRFIQYPQDVPFGDWELFERFCRRHLPVAADQFDGLMDYLHNFQVLNFDLRTGEVYPVIPRPDGFNVPIPVAGAPGPYIG